MDTRLSRRRFLGTSAAATAAAGLTVGFNLSGAAAAGAAPEFDAWLRIAPDGAVTLLSRSCEIGQGALSGLAQVLADELDADPADVRVEMAPVTAAYEIKGLDYLTGGSGTMRRGMEPLRKAAAGARARLTEAAARRWGVLASDCTTAASRVSHAASGRSLPYGALAAEAAGLPAPAEAPLKPRERWTRIGREVAREDIPAKVDGSARFGIDQSLPGLLVATIRQSPVLGGKLRSVDPGPALKVRGVKRVVRLPDAVAVVATGYWAAAKGLDALAPAWDDGALAGLDTEGLYRHLRDRLDQATEVTAAEGEDKAARVAAAEKALAAAGRVTERVYEAPLLSHSPMEPMNATARVTADGAELWVPTQVPARCRDDVAKALGLDPARVAVHPTLAGGGFGRRLRTDYAVQAALVARDAGAPVKLVWSREEDTRHGFYRPASVVRLRAALDAAGAVTAMVGDIACLSDDNFGIAFSPYAFGAELVRYGVHNPGVPTGAWRAVDLSQNCFFMESFVDELAHEAGADPVEYRRGLIRELPRARRVLDAAAEAAGWGKAPPAGCHRGVAVIRGFGSFVAQVAEVSVAEDGLVRVHRITCAIDCGTAVNPGSVRAQVEGAVAMGLTAALAGEINLKGGQVVEGNFDSYPLLPLAAMPEVETIILESPGERVGGVGEPPLPPVAPAVANALFAATGKRVRSLPFSRHGFRMA